MICRLPGAMTFTDTLSYLQGVPIHWKKGYLQSLNDKAADHIYRKHTQTTAHGQAKLWLKVEFGKTRW